MPKDPPAQGDAQETATIALSSNHAGAQVTRLLSPDRPLIVGRAPAAGLRIDDPTLSREHARFLLSGSRVLVEDLGSKNGTFFAGSRVTRVELTIGDEIVLGSVALQVQALDMESGSAQLPAREEGPEGALIAGQAMRPVLETVASVATSRIPIILHGETGTGKEVLAQLIHDSGPRKGRRIVRVNCAAIPKDLVESTLFGHERGAFTGALQQQKGVFEEADGGTVFLDEIGELPPAAQASLLRVLEVGAFNRVGSSREIQVDVRIVAATHRDLEAMADEGTFRADLYYRLSGVVIEIPPLRDRQDELEPLAWRFLHAANKANGRRVEGLSPETFALLKAYSWPGNVRELRNVIERAVVVTQGALIGPEDLPARVRTGGRSPEARPGKASAPETQGPEQAREKVHQFEARMLQETLAAVGWNRAEAARKLGMPVRTLSYRLKVLGVKKPQ
jgi:transcriptional regulator with GAF, ATPase, and Fis domain